MAPKPLKHFDPGLIEAFQSKVRKGKPNECWPWTGGSFQHRYGIFNKLRTHRIAYFLTHGIVPDGLSVLHRCDNPPCCNPNHLFLGTQADNMHDKRNKGRSVRQSRLTQSDVLKIVKEWGAGHTGPGRCPEGIPRRSTAGTTRLLG